MPARRSKLKNRRSSICPMLRAVCVALITFAILVPTPITDAASTVVGNLIQITTQVLRQEPRPAESSQSVAPRLSLLAGETRNIPVAFAATSVLVVNPEIASAEVAVGGLTLTGIHVGETILIAFEGQTRHTFLVVVLGRTRATTHQNIAPEISIRDQFALSGSYNLSFTAAVGSGPGLLHQTLDFQKRLTQGRTMRFSSDIFKFLGTVNLDRARATVPGVGLNRLSLGVDGPSLSMDFLDSQVDTSRLSFTNYTMRGLHLVSTAASPLKGAEIFAGFARPSLSLFDMNQGRLLGIVIPVAHGEVWSVRAGFFAVSPGKNNRLAAGGTVWHVDGHYSPNANLGVDGEMDYSNGGLSWRAGLNLSHGPFSAYCEILHLDHRNALVSIGAQPGGRRTEALSFQWHAGARLNTTFSFNHTALVPPSAAGRATLERTTFLASASFRLNPNSRFSFRLAQQQILSGSFGGTGLFQLETRTATIGYDLKLNQRWSNSFEARMSSTREARADAQTQNGLTLRDQLRFSFRRGSATGFMNYTRQNESLAGLIVRNPQLLPPLLQRVFAADPALFLQTNRESLALLLPGIELPQTRGLELGVRLQTAFSRVNLEGEVRYNSAEFPARPQRNVLASMSMTVRLDSANSLQVNASKSIGLDGPTGQTALTFSYTHRFGAGSGDGFQFARMLGLDRGQVAGRVFLDLNHNGQDDPGEPGVAGMTVQVDGDRGIKTDQSGTFRFSLNSGEYNVAVISDQLGLQLRASTATEQHVSVLASKTINVGFGISNDGTLSGRVFNDLSLKSTKAAGNQPGVAGVLITLIRIDAVGQVLSMRADGNGSYQFRNLSPGAYKISIDQVTLPADFVIPSQTSWLVSLNPSQSVYLDIPLSAQRSLSGVVFFDRDNDGKYSPDKDEPVEGALVIAGNNEVTSGKGGAYIFRNLPAGRILVSSRTPSGLESPLASIELTTGPIRRKGVNLAVKSQSLAGSKN